MGLLTGDRKYPTLQASTVKKVMENDGKLNDEFVESLDSADAKIIEEVFDYVDKDHVKTVQMYGNNCHLPGSLQGALHAFLKFAQNTGEDSSRENIFEEAVRA